ncbi:MAG: P-loop NTPase [Candidatus Magnetobacterium sp. LHC-1]|uniref:P-loop NTPase n=1 Tax=Candidatus Magnetobacterium casense TaxID=1455061 RepID=A0ABS6S395_9BACT|nr:P-loop NTPase [Candidatus Magnetobacterium casensis]MBF0608584.1 P-loop NTPase [Nitrospirota bacterium]MBV6342873.1 P-loop NTPase [Candidatus Magnetobacterium casensis]
MTELPKKAGHILAVAGGKGGVGKSIFSVTLSTTLAMMGYRVIVVDLDLGGANLHTYFGVIDRTLSLFHFIHKKVGSLNDIVVKTPITNLSLISGAHYSPTMSNPAAELKVKLIRHLYTLDADFIVIDLGAGMDLSTLDFFIFADRGFLVTVPEPGAVMNAYRFIQGALFRKMVTVFGKHKEIGAIVRDLGQACAHDESAMLSWFVNRVKEIDPEVFPLVQEVSCRFQPFLVLNRIAHEQAQQLASTLIRHCSGKYAVDIKYLGNLPDVKSLTSFLLDVPGFLKSDSGKGYLLALKSVVRRFLIDLHDANVLAEKLRIRSDFNEKTIETLSDVIDKLDSAIVNDAGKKLWKLRLFFKPVEVVKFLLSKGVKEDIFFESDSLNLKQ